MPGEGLRGLSPTCRLCQVGCQGQEREGHCSCLLPPGYRHSELAGQPCGCSPPCSVLCAWEGPGRSLCPVTGPWGC